MSKLSQIVRNKAPLTVEIDGTDDDGNPIKVPVQVTYLPRKSTLEFRGRFAEHMQVLVKAEADEKAARERGATDAEVVALVDAVAVEKAAQAISEMALELLDSWDLEDEDDKGKAIPLPIPRSPDEVKAFPAPELFQSVMQAVMGALNPNRKADETSEKDSSAT